MSKIGANIESNFYNNVSNYYSDSLSVEKAILQRPVILPPVSEEYIDFRTLEAYSKIDAQFITTDDAYTDVKANFSIPLISPMVEDGESTVMIHDAPDIEAVHSIGSAITEGFQEMNFVPLIIPKFIVMNFRNEIPKGTEFIINFTGGTLSYSNIHIMGVGNIGEESVFPEEYLEAHKILNWGELLELADGDEEMVPEILQARIEERDAMFEELQEKYHFNFPDEEEGGE